MRYKPEDVLIRARNGDVIAYDDTGLILRLSDEVLSDIRERIWGLEAPAAALRDVDGWNARAEGAWIRFDACLPPFSHSRAYRRRAPSGDVIADAQGPLLAVLTVGGAAASLSFEGVPHFTRHVVTMGDDLGASGACGTERVRACDALQTLTETTLTSLVGDAILTGLHAQNRPLPLIAARSETDEATTADGLLEGPGLQNVERVLDGLHEASRTLGTSLRVLAVTIDYGAEDVTSPVPDFVRGIHAVVDRILEACARRNLARPTVLLRCDGGAEGHLRQWELAACPAGQPVVVTAPGYALPRDRHGRLTREGAAIQAALDAAALGARAVGEAWRCPLPVLAERHGARQINVTFLSDGPIDLAGAPPVGTAEAFGFAVAGSDAPAISSVEIHPKDDRMVVLNLSGPAADVAHVDYAVGGPGAVRDDWRGEPEGTDAAPCRWALPARLTLH